MATGYTIVWNVDPVALQTRVAQMIGQGWTPVGGVCTATSNLPGGDPNVGIQVSGTLQWGRFFQAMTI